MTDISQSKNGFFISTDKAKLDIESIHQFLSTKAYWCLNIPRATVERAVENSICFGIYDGRKQVGFARVITDAATIAYLGDVYVLEEYRGKGLSKWLMETITSHPDLQGLRRWILLTSDAHSLYKQFGWKEIADPTKWMDRHDKNVYVKK